MTAPLPGDRQDRFLVFGAPLIGEAEIDEVVASMRAAWIGTGPKVARFEERMGEYLGAGHTVAVNSCTAALHLSMLAAGIEPGDEVITTAMTFVATANAILHAGATPVLVDVDRRTGLIDPDAIRAAVTSRTRAIVPVHMYGRPCDMDAIQAIAAEHDLRVIEDAAHALEARYRGRKIGTIGDLTAFSFYVTKNMTTGEGGMIATADPELAARTKTLALHGITADAWKRFSDEGYRHYQCVAPGFKYNMMDLQAAIGLHQLPRLEAWLARRAEIWERYDVAFADLPVETPAPPADEPGTTHARHLYTLLVDRDTAGIGRDTLMQRLHDRGVGTGVHYVGVHLHPYYRDTFGYAPDDFPNATHISERTLSIPLSPGLTDGDVDRVIEAVRDALP
jgi:dTDP-4-amino-4,6-dideoxygalactose transaminase